jgi:hypothetical protein
MLFGFVIFYVADVFAITLCQVSTSLPYIWYVACLAGEFIYRTSIAVWYFFWVLGFDDLLYCVCAFESDVYVCMFKEIGKLSDFWALVCKCCLFFVFIVCCSYVSFVLYLCFSLAMCVVGKLLFALWFLLFPILSVVFLLLVGVTAFCWCDSYRLRLFVRSGGWIRSW